MHAIAWHERQPGHFEVDLVHHGGPTSDGQYIHTLQLLDIATAWSERVAVLGRSYLVMEDGFRRCQARLPFPIVELHPDNGVEFLNDLMVRFWKDALPVPHLSRSRPYRKNDNRFVEQKNRCLVRDFFGPVRLDTVAQTILLNQLYDRMWLYYNFFQPVLRLAGKVVLDDGNTHTIRRRFDQPRTPFERLGASGVVSIERRQALEPLRHDTNPRQLRQEIYALVEQIVRAPGARPGKTGEVRKTLLPAGCWSGLSRSNLLAAPRPSRSGPVSSRPAAGERPTSRGPAPATTCLPSPPSQPAGSRLHRPTRSDPTLVQEHRQ